MFAQQFRSSKTFIIFVVCIAIFTDTLLLNIVLPVLPYALSDRIGLSESDTQKWNSILLAAYGMTLIFGSLLFGWIGDHLSSRQTPFVLGLVLLAGATLCFALGENISILLIARLFQGFSSAVVFTFGRALILDQVGREKIGRAMGYTGTAMSAGLILGPVVGGVLYQIGGYFTVFLVPIGMIVAEVILRLLVVEKKLEKSVSRYQTQSPVEILRDDDLENRVRPCNQTAKLNANLQGVSASGGRGSPPDESHSLLGGDKRKGSYLVLLRSPRFAATISSLLILSGLANGFDAILPAYAHDTLDLATSQVAVLFLAMGLPMTLAPVAGWATDRYGPKWPASTGLIVMLPSLVLLRLIRPELAHPFLGLVLLMCFIGISFSLTMTALQVEATAAVEDMEDASPGIFGELGATSQAYGLMNTAFAVGSMVGPLFTGFTRVWLGWSATTLLMSILAATVLLVTITMTGGYCVGQRIRHNE